MTKDISDKVGLSVFVILMLLKGIFADPQWKYSVEFIMSALALSIVVTVFLMVKTNQKS